MPKEMQTSFVIRGSVDQNLLNATAELAAQVQAADEKLKALGDQKTLLQTFDTLSRKIDNTYAKLQSVTEGTKEWQRTWDAMQKLFSQWGAAGDQLKQFGVNLNDVAGEQKRVNAELEKANALREESARKLERERQEYNAWMADANKYGGLGQREYDAITKAQSDAAKSAERRALDQVAFDNRNADERRIAQEEAARLAYEQRKREEVAFNNWNADFEASQQANRIAQAQARTRLNVTSFMGGLGGFSFGGAAMSALGGVLPAYLGGAAVKGAFDLAKASVSEAMNFDVVISELRAYTSATERQTAALREVALDIGLNTVFTASEAAKAMTYLGKAGWTTGQIQSGIRGVMNLSAASGEDIASVASIVADAIGAFSPTGLTPADSAYFADVLAKTATRSNTDVGLIGETFRTSAPVAGALGYSIEDVSQMIGLMANVGIKGSRAGTTTRNILNAFASGFSITGARLGDYTYSAVNADGSMKSLRQTIDELRVAFSKLSNEEKVAAANEIAGMRGYAGLLGILNATEEEYARLAEEIKNADGAAEEMAERRLDNLQGDVTKLTSAFSQLKIQIGEELNPELRGMVQLLTSAIRIAQGEPPELGDEAKDILLGGYGRAMKNYITNGYGISDYFVHDENGWRLTFPEWNENVVNDADDVTDSVLQVADAYDEVAKTAEESFKKQFDLWEQATEIIPKDIYDLLDAQESQAEYWRQYTENLDELYARTGNIPGLQAFLQANATGTADSVALIAGLAEASDAEIKEFMRLYAANENAQLRASEAQTFNITINAPGADGSTIERLEEYGGVFAERVAHAIQGITDDEERRSLFA